MLDLFQIPNSPPVKNPLKHKALRDFSYALKYPFTTIFTTTSNFTPFFVLLGLDFQNP